MTADRDALLDLLGAVELLAVHGHEHLRETAARARRHVDRAQAHAAVSARAEPRSTREYGLDLVAVIGVHEQSTGFELVLSALAAAEERGREAALRPFEDLFADGPDTVGRTTWREEEFLRGQPPERIECVEVPLYDLRAAFEAAGGGL